MKVLSIILGVLLIMGGFFLMLTPGATFASMSWVVGFLLLLSGVNSVIDFFMSRKSGKKSGWGLIGGILLGLLGIAVLISPYNGLFTDVVLIFAFDFWLIIGGILRIIASVQLKKAGNASWGWVLAFAILSVVAGLYALFHIVASALAIGILVGVVVLISGFNLIAAASVAGAGGEVAGGGEPPAAA